MHGLSAQRQPVQWVQVHDECMVQVHAPVGRLSLHMQPAPVVDPGDEESQQQVGHDDFCNVLLHRLGTLAQEGLVVLKVHPRGAKDAQHCT
jgi:hypothetical protein